MLLRANILAVLCLHTEQAFLRESNVSSGYSAKFQTQNLLFGLQPPCRCLYTRALWLCVVHTLNKRFRGKVMFLVCAAQSSERSLYFWLSANMEELFHASILAVLCAHTEQSFLRETNVSWWMTNAKFQTQNQLFGLQRWCRCFYTPEFWLCAVCSLNKRFRRKVMFSCLYSKEFQAQNLLFGFQPPWRCFYTRAFWLCVVHTLNTRFSGKVMFLFCKSAKCQTQNLLFVLEPRCIHTLNKRFSGKVMFLVFNYRWSFLKKKEITTQAESSQDDYYVKLLPCNGFLKFEPMQSWQGSPEPILQRNISCLYFSHFVWILFGLFALFVGIFFCLSSKIVWSGNPDMATLESVGSTRVVVRTFAPSPQTLWRACQVVLSASCMKARGRFF